MSRQLIESIIKLQQRWHVGEKYFPTEEAAWEYIRLNNVKIAHEIVAASLREIIRAEPYGEANENSAKSMAAKLLNLYEMYLR